MQGDTDETRQGRISGPAQSPKDASAQDLIPSKGRRPKRLWALLPVILIGLVAWRYGVPFQVEDAVAQPGPLPVTVSGPGLLDALVKVDASARVQGRIVALPVDENDVVKAGALIARLDASDTQQQLVQARADAEAAHRAVAAAESDRASAQASLTQAQQDYDRKAALLRTGAGSRADYDLARSNRDQAAAALARADTSIRQARASAASADANIQVVAARLSDSTILSPIDGVVSNRDQSLGDIVTPGAPVVELVDPATIIMAGRFDESVMGQLAPGQPATVLFNAFPGRSFKGRVLRLGRSVDTTTREFEVDVTLLELPPHWAIGQRATVTIETGTKPDSITVPLAAIAFRSGKPGVWVANNGHRARWRPVRLGHAGGSRIEVTDGLASGDVVLLDPDQLYAWAPVRVSTAADPRS